jgi:hypothetical protein
MKSSILLAALLLIADRSTAGDWRNPDTKFEARKKMSETISLTWRTVDDVQKACEQESRRRGNGGFGFSLEACSFWNSQGTECVIITKNQSSLHDIGHELRHCFQGNYH